MATRLNVVNPALREARNDLIYPPRADFRGDFTSSIIPQQSIGSIAFTRGTTATVTDNDGIIRNCLSGEARFKGARRVQNLYTYSEDITNAVWNPISCTRTKNAGIAPDGTNTAGLVTSAVATALTEFNQNYNIVSGQTYILSVSLKANGGLQYVQLIGNSVTFGVGYINVDLSNGTITANVPGAANMQATVTPEANGFYRIQFKATAIANLANNHLSVAMIPSGTSARTASFPGDGIKGFYYWHPQFEDVTGQSVQTAAEYVSTNVLSSPFHGANVDGVKYFDTDVSGVAIPKTTLKGLLVEGTRTNLCNYSNIAVAGWGLIASTRTDNAGIAPDGTNSMVKIIPNTGTQSSYVYNVNITTAASVYTVSCYVKAAGFNFVQLRFSSSISNGYANFDLQNGVVGTMSLWTSSGIEATSIAGVYRVWAVTDTVVATTAAVAVQIVPASNSGSGAPITGDGVNGVLVWGMQIENGLNSSSYIPTTTTTVTRNIDSLIMNTKNAIDTYGACSFIATIEDNSQFDRRIMSFTSNTSNRLQFQVKRALSGANLFYGDGSGVPSVTPGQDVGANNVVIAWTNLSNVSLYMNNIKYNSGVAPNLVFTTVDIGSAGGQPGFGCIKNVRIWKTRPTDAELLALSNSSY